MSSTQKWEAQLDEVADVAFQPTSRFLRVYDVKTGHLTKTLKAHRATVRTISFSGDGRYFASGGDDCRVIIWNGNLQGFLQYQHEKPVIHAKFNVNQELVSCSFHDFGIWTLEKQHVFKKGTRSRIMCCNWSPNGQYFAMGFKDGKISIRNNRGKKVCKAKRDSPLTCVVWNPVVGPSGTHTLLVADESRSLAFYQLANGQLIKHGDEIQLSYEPHDVEYLHSGTTFCIGGSNCQAVIASREVPRLATILESTDQVLKCKPLHHTTSGIPRSYLFVVAHQGGKLRMVEFTFPRKHALYGDLYCYQDLMMTDVIVQTAATREQRFRLYCESIVIGLALFKQLLAVQLPDKMVVYKAASHGRQLEYVKEREVRVALEGNLLLISSHYLASIRHNTVQLVEWSGTHPATTTVDLEDTVRYAKVAVLPGGEPTEQILVGLRSGAVARLDMPSRRLTALYKHPLPIIYLDLNRSADRLAVVDDKHGCVVVALQTPGGPAGDPPVVVSRDQDIQCVAWNETYPHLLCLTSSLGVYILRNGPDIVAQDFLAGAVVGFDNAVLSCLKQYGEMKYIDIALPEAATIPVSNAPAVRPSLAPLASSPTPLASSPSPPSAMSPASLISFEPPAPTLAAASSPAYPPTYGFPVAAYSAAPPALGSLPYPPNMHTTGSMLVGSPQLPLYFPPATTTAFGGMAVGTPTSTAASAFQPGSFTYSSTPLGATPAMPIVSSPTRPPANAAPAMATTPSAATHAIALRSSSGFSGASLAAASSSSSSSFSSSPIPMGTSPSVQAVNPSPLRVDSPSGPRAAQVPFDDVTPFNPFEDSAHDTSDPFVTTTSTSATTTAPTFDPFADHSPVPAEQPDFDFFMAARGATTATTTATSTTTTASGNTAASVTKKDSGVLSVDFAFEL